MNLKKVCFICAAVVITWAGMLIWMWSGHNIDKILLAILMGTSVGAIATRYAQNMIWKSLIVILSIPAVWYAVQDQLDTAAIFIFLIILPSIYFNSKLNSPAGEQKGVQQEDRFKDCC